jgi:hypothetical protein
MQAVLDDVMRQLLSGKGRRHGGGATPFYDQPWVTLYRTHGAGFLTGQAAKKLDEAVRARAKGEEELSRGVFRDDTSSGGGHAEAKRKIDEAWEREVLGAIVYLGMAVLAGRGFP